MFVKKYHRYLTKSILGDTLHIGTAPANSCKNSNDERNERSIMTDDVMMYEFMRSDVAGFFTTNWTWLVMAMFLAGAVFLWYKQRSHHATVVCLVAGFVIGFAALVKMAGLTAVAPHYLVLWGVVGVLLTIGGHQADTRRLAKFRRGEVERLQCRVRLKPARN